jgi:hypothetical protein
MNATDIAILTIGSFGLSLAAFALWLIWPRDEASRPGKSGIKPAE